MSLLYVSRETTLGQLESLAIGGRSGCKGVEISFLPGTYMERISRPRFNYYSGLTYCHRFYV